MVSDPLHKIKKELLSTLSNGKSLYGIFLFVFTGYNLCFTI